jgi:hypothetical protein
MTRKIKIEDKKKIDIKFTKEAVIDSKTFKKDGKYKLELVGVDGEEEVKHDQALPGNKFKGKLYPKKDDGNDEDTPVDVDLKGKFDKGYF